ncbi:MAG TPA: hypothetical protein VJ063_09240 [Verrucomicrobiae bacterium]|nr:hypothetical protein [Verrucomicrobiae bacterium]
MKIGISKRLRWVLGFTVLPIAMVLLWYGFENLHGALRWQRCKRNLIARGEKVEFKELIPPPVPAEQNFANASLFQDLDFKSVEPFTGATPTNPVAVAIQAFDRVANTIHHRSNFLSSTRDNRNLTDFVAWQRAFEGVYTNKDTQRLTNAADAVLQYLHAYDSILEEVRGAIERPHTRFDIDYFRQNPWEMPLPHLDRLRSVCRIASLKACAELATGRSENAWQDVQLCFRIIDSIKPEPILISYLIRAACVHVTVQPIWEGLALGHWTDADLERLQNELDRFDFIADERTVLEAERTVGLATPDIFYRYPREMYESVWDFGGLNSTLPEEKTRSKPCGRDCWVLRLAPRGWWQKEKCNYAEMFDRIILSGVDFSNRVVHPSAINANRLTFDSEPKSFISTLFQHRFMVSVGLPALVHTHMRAAHAQTHVHQMLIACALERHKRATGEYPASLEACRFLKRVPHDLIGGAPLKYKIRKRFLLYSVGWDETDDSGNSASSDWSTWSTPKKGDWVWSYPETPE